MLVDGEKRGKSRRERFSATALLDDEEGKVVAQRTGPLCSDNDPYGDIMALMREEEGVGAAPGKGAQTPGAEKGPELCRGRQKDSKVRDVAPSSPV